MAQPIDLQTGRQSSGGTTLNTSITLHNLPLWQRVIYRYRSGYEVQNFKNSILSIFQFWSVYVLCSAQNKDAVRLTLEQIDVVKRMCETYEEFEMVTTADGKAASILMRKHQGEI